MQLLLVLSGLQPGRGLDHLQCRFLASRVKSKYRLFLSRARVPIAAFFYSLKSKIRDQKREPITVLAARSAVAASRTAI
jgi:hypothetical protein